MSLLRTRSQGNVLIVSFREANILEWFTVQQIAEELLVVLQETEQPNVALDLSGVDRLTSMGITLLFRANRVCKERGRKLIVCGLNDLIDEIFKIMDLDKVFRICQDAEHAVRAFACMEE